ncbi:polysaccharide pyruvyl transferase family protein [Subtercola sp. PAMC28395]|uniref:polysaccharide pyruvyl transferase family protein n=1 Tax=Subtercola sp. PAMC28395 TaxID=2846775 RepID=UPI001C0DCB3E|nr:polysaccharide pyruvyl transferase family protein [Subtercola sp. PAMC28395]QWT24308.1 polysaccharide pyruvyl transferase family protein [Subtercola sp. PAMC28395]
MTTTPTPRRIVFLGTHGQYNIGDELLLESFLAQLGRENRYLVNSYDPAFTRAQLAGRYTVEVIDTSKDRRQLLRGLLSCDLLCFGGGSIIKELYASTGRNRYSTLLMILAIVTFTHRIARKPIAMLNIGVGPLRSPRGLRIARMILSQVDELTVRDAKSLATCQSIGVDALQATDAVFSASPEWLLGRAPLAEPAPRASTDPLKVALNLNFDIENPENWELFLERLALALERVNDHHPIELHALAMQVGFKQNDDGEILDAFAARLPSVTFHRHELHDHNDVARLIESCDLVVSERFHAIVIASILGVPSVVLAYDVKVSGLANMLGLSDWTVDINQPFEAAALAGQMVDLIEQRETVSVQVRERSAELEVEARRNFDSIRQWIAGIPLRGKQKAA